MTPQEKWKSWITAPTFTKEMNLQRIASKCNSNWLLSFGELLLLWLIFQICLVFPLLSAVYLGCKIVFAVREWNKFAISHQQEAISHKAEMRYLLCQNSMQVKISFLIALAKYDLLLPCFSLLQCCFFPQKGLILPVCFIPCSRQRLSANSVDRYSSCVCLHVPGHCGSFLGSSLLLQQQPFVPSAEELGFFTQLRTEP